MSHLLKVSRLKSTVTYLEMSPSAQIIEKSIKRKRISPIRKSSDAVCLWESDDINDVQAKILSLENAIFESKKNYNKIVDLIVILESFSEINQNLVATSVSLCRIFTRFMVSGDLKKRRNATEKEAVVIKWLRGHYLKYKKILVHWLANGSLASTILILCMRLLKTEGQYLQVGEHYTFPTSFLTDIVQSLLSAQTDKILRDQFCLEFIKKYYDIRFYTLEVIAKVIDTEAKDKANDIFFNNCLQLLASIESPPNSIKGLEDPFLPAPQKTTHALYSVSQHKKRAQAAWLALMRLDMNKKQRKLVLKLISTSIALWFSKPEILMDFLVDSYDSGGSISLLALSGLFYLMQERNLDYPLFYRKLYSLLDSDILHSKHRSQFFRLLDIFLGSTHLPVVLVASFIKKFSRLTLNAPPSGIVVVIPWIYNLLKKHPQCSFMIHREIRDPEVKELNEKEGMYDPFLPNELDPMETKAIESSLWEIFMLQSHYHPGVATLAKIISEQFTKQSYNIEDFLDHTYSSMLEAELRKEVKNAPVVEFEIPVNIFTKPDPGSATTNSLLTKLWDL